MFDLNLQLLSENYCNSAESTNESKVSGEVQLVFYKRMAKDSGNIRSKANGDNSAQKL